MAKTRLSLLTGKMQLVRERPAVRSSPLTREQLAHLREAAATQRAQADSLLGLLDHADQATADAATARAEAERLRKEIESRPPVTAAPAQMTTPTTVASGAPPDPAAIGITYHRTETGLLRRMSLRAPGFRDTHVDVYRDAAGKMLGLKIADE